MFEGTPKQALRPVGKVEVGFVCKELGECVEVLELVGVEQTAGMFIDAPELDLVGDRVFLEAINESVVSE